MSSGKVLVLGGTAPAREIAAALVERGVDVVSSLAGRVREPLLPPGAVRVGGFGGPAALADRLRAEHVGVVVDATHPFAVAVTAEALAATRSAGVPLVVLDRPGWTAGPGDDWRWVGSLPDAAIDLPGRRVLLTTGRRGAAAFAGVRDRWFLLRAVDPPEPPLPPRREVLLARGPFTLEGERQLLRDHRIDVVVTRDSGGDATAPKLTAARDLGLPVVIVRRPPLPPDLPPESVVHSVAAVLTRVR